ncbi:MAG TPA: hypothetical protein VHX16_06755 [Chloroflexota bacterium]|nr:hypothetical protein [Chloroflexota bacterium]
MIEPQRLSACPESQGLNAGIPTSATMDLQRTSVMSICSLGSDSHLTSFMGELGCWARISARTIYRRVSRVDSSGMRCLVGPGADGFGLAAVPSVSSIPGSAEMTKWS